MSACASPLHGWKPSPVPPKEGDPCDCGERTWQALPEPVLTRPRLDPDTVAVCPVCALQLTAERLATLPPVPAGELLGPCPECGLAMLEEAR